MQLWLYYLLYLIAKLTKATDHAAGGALNKALVAAQVDLKKADRR